MHWSEVKACINVMRQLWLRKILQQFLNNACHRQSYKTWTFTIAGYYSLEHIVNWNIFIHTFKMLWLFSSLATRSNYKTSFIRSTFCFDSFFHHILQTSKNLQKKHENKILIKKRSRLFIKFYNINKQFESLCIASLMLVCKVQSFYVTSNPI